MIKKDNLIKSILTHLVAIVIFLGISVAYFSPLLENKTLPKGDITQYQGASQELRTYYNDEGESSAWTNSMFSGMPAYQIGVWGDNNVLGIAEHPLRALGDEVGPVFTAMLMAYIMFLCLGFHPFAAILGAIGYSLGSYNIIIIAAGHITKAWALAYLPLILASMLVMYKRKYILGGILMALGLALQIKSNHLQITYYAGILCAFLYAGLLYEFIRQKDYKAIAKSTGILVIAAVLGVLSNVTNIYTNYEMGEESTRGQSELTPREGEQKSSGLDKDYAFAWSYGKAETLTLLIPDIHGGATGGMLGKDSHLYKELKDRGVSQMITPKGVQAYTYWGDQSFTAGPVYFGAIICFLFLLGMLVIRSHIKWWMFAATIFFVLLSWGSNLDGFNTFFFNHLPLYNKFRTVSMALVIPAITMLVIAVWGVKELFSNKIEKKKGLKALYISAGITAGICLLFWAMPDFAFKFSSKWDALRLGEMPDWYTKALLLDRKDLLSSDALRSFCFIVAAAVLIFIARRTYESDKRWAGYCLIGLSVLVLADLWMVDKRYLNNDNFVSETTHKQNSFPKSLADEAILQDKGASHRVLSLNDPFNEARTSYYHKSIGGYHAAKLKRYQELIDYHLQNEIQYIGSLSNQYLQTEVNKLNAKIQAKEEANPMESALVMQDSLSKHVAMTNAINMLNTKYIIYHPELPPMTNHSALGNAWFVQEYATVDNADEEINAIAEYDLRNTAVVDKRFVEELEGIKLQMDSTANIALIECKPNMLKYKSSAKTEQLAVLSEIYYPHGWQAYIDGKPVNHIRANWTLRAMRIPAGEHEIEFKFEPKGYNTSVTIANISSSILILAFAGSIAYPFVRNRKKKKELKKE